MFRCFCCPHILQILDDKILRHIRLTPGVLHGGKSLVVVLCRFIFFITTPFYSFLLLSRRGDRRGVTPISGGLGLAVDLVLARFYMCTTLLPPLAGQERPLILLPWVFHLFLSEQPALNVSSQGVFCLLSSGGEEDGRSYFLVYKLGGVDFPPLTEAKQ